MEQLRGGTALSGAETGPGKPGQEGSGGDARDSPNLTETEVADFAEASDRREFSRGDVVVREGAAGDHVMLVHSGHQKVCRWLGAREAILSIAEPGSLLGEMSALDGSPYSATIVALERSEIDFMSIDRFGEFVRLHAGMGDKLLRIGAARLRETSDRQVEFATTDTVSRVCATLARLSGRYGTQSDKGTEIVTPLSQRELAEWSGMSREAFVKALARLRTMGWVSVEDRVIILRDAPAVYRRGGRSDHPAR